MTSVFMRIIGSLFGFIAIALSLFLWFRQDILPPLIDSIILEKRIVGIDDNLSGLTWDNKTRSLLAITNKPEVVYQLDRDGNILAHRALPELNDTESISVGWGETFLIAEERRRKITPLALSFQGEHHQILPTSLSLDLGGRKNEGFEGVAFSQSSGTLFIANEKNPAVVFKIEGFNQPDSPLSIEKIYTSVKDISGLTWCDERKRLYVLSDEAKTITEMDNKGFVLRVSNLSDFVQVAIPQPEGVAVEGNKLYVVSEPNYFYVFNMVAE